MSNLPGWADFFLQACGVKDKSACGSKKKKKADDADAVAPSQTPFARPAGGTVRGRRKAKKKKKKS